MMKTFFTEIAFVRLAARLSGVTLYDNYAYHGMLARNRSLPFYEAKPVPDIDDVPEKSASFQFGIRCARALYSFCEDPDGDAALARDAMIARVFLLDLESESAKKVLAAVPARQLADELVSILRGYMKRSQIQTHTAKPGYEDIETWLLRYHNLREAYEATLPRLAALMLEPGSAADGFEAFFDRSDPIIALAMGQEIQPDRVGQCLSGNRSVFGRALAALFV